MKTKQKAKNEFLYFALRNWKVLLGFSIILIFLLLALIGPSLTENEPLAFVYPQGASKPSSEFWMGTTMFGQDVFSQFANGLRATFYVGLLAGGRRLVASHFHLHSHRLSRCPSSKHTTI